MKRSLVFPTSFTIRRKLLSEHGMQGKRSNENSSGKSHEQDMKNGNWQRIMSTPKSTHPSTNSTQLSSRV